MKKMLMILCLLVLAIPALAEELKWDNGTYGEGYWIPPDAAQYGVVEFSPTSYSCGGVLTSVSARFDNLPSTIDDVHVCVFADDGGKPKTTPFVDEEWDYTPGNNWHVFTFDEPVLTPTPRFYVGVSCRVGAGEWGDGVALDTSESTGYNWVYVDNSWYKLNDPYPGHNHNWMIRCEWFPRFLHVNSSNNNRLVCSSESALTVTTWGQIKATF